MRSGGVVFAALLVVSGSFAAEPPAVCPFGPGARPAGTLPAGAPHGAQIPIDTIVVLMQENRSFDHYMGRLHAQGKRDSEPLPKTASNPDPTAPGQTIRVFHDPRRCEVADLAHGWTQVHQEFNDGAMDGFASVLNSIENFEGAVRQTKVPNLDVMTTGPKPGGRY